MFPPAKLQIESASMLTKIIISSSLCHNDTIYKEWLNTSIISRESMLLAQTQFWSKFEIMT